MPKVTEAHTEARREQIMEAASHCFSREGFHKTTINDICRESALSPGAIYRYFPSKEEIIAATAEQSLQRSIALVREIKEHGETRRVLDELVETFFGPLDCADCEQDIRCDIELWSEALREPRIMEVERRGMGSFRQHFAEIIRRAQKLGEINPRLDPEAVARTMIAFHAGLVVQKAMDPRTDVKAYVTAMKAMMIGQFWQGTPDDTGIASRKE